MMTHKHYPLVLILALAVTAFSTLPQAAQAQHSKKLFDSIRSSDYVALNTMLKNGADINQTDKSKNTPLMLAAKIGDRLVVDALLSGDADPNIRNSAGATALMLAAKYGHVHVVEQLILYGADPLIKNKNGHLASKFASAYGHKEVFLMLLDSEKEALKGREITEKTTS